MIFDPSDNISINSPDLFPGSFPVVKIGPPKTVNILKHPSSIDNNIILPIINKHSHILQSRINISRIAFGNILPKSSIHCLIAGDELYIGSECCFVCVQKRYEGLVHAIVVTEIENAYVTHVCFGGCVVVCQEIEVICGLLVILTIDTHNGVTLEPSTGVSELLGDDSC